MEEVFAAIDGKTRVCGLLGNPVEHTVSPAIHNALARACNVNMAYLPFLVDKGRLLEAVQGAYALNMLGMNVTVPYKKDVIPFLCETDPLAAAVGSVNTLVRVSGGFKGYNTDMSGLYRAMGEDQVFLEGENVILLGAGGVGRAVAYLCAMKGAACVYLLNRDADKACRVAQEVNQKSARDCVRGMGLDGWRRLPKSCGRFLCIQATSVGLYPHSEQSPIEDPDFYERIHTGYDLIYRPAQTKFMRLTKEAKGRCYNGLKMLVYQGVEAFELWNGLTVEKEVAARIYEMLSTKAV